MSKEIELKTSEKSMIKQVQEKLQRILGKNRAGSIFNPSEEIAIEYALKDLLGMDTSDIERRLVEARKRFCNSFCDLKDLIEELIWLSRFSDPKTDAESLQEDARIEELENQLIEKYGLTFARFDTQKKTGNPP